MRRAICFSTFLTIIFCATNTFAVKLDFSGTWVMDSSRSIGQPANSEQSMIITQTDDKLQIEVKLVSPQGERTISDVYMLDGKEAEFTPPVPPGAPPAKGKRTITWLPRGNGIVVTEETTVETTNGTVKNQLTRKWILSPDGQTLTIDLYFDGPNASFETRRVFVKK